jgi:predicted AAA+ superfamily ATPase
MLLQKLKELNLPTHKAAYFSLDDIYFTTNTLVDTVRSFRKGGGEYLFLDEVHKYPNWSIEIKNIYDQMKDIQMVFTGSSIIDITKQEVDLSRRALMWQLPGLSYREYLKMNDLLDVGHLSLEKLLDPQENLRSLFPSTFKPYEYFSDYLKYGYYPFSIEDKLGYFRRLKQVVRLIVEFDMAELKEFDLRNAKKMLQLLQIISDQVPFKPNLVKLAERSSIHRNTILNYLSFLDQAKLIHLLYPYGNSIALLQKPEKIFLEKHQFIICSFN